METKIIKAIFSGVRSIVSDARTQFDYGQIIEVLGIDLPDVFEARFSTAPTGESIRVLGENQRVSVPDELLMEVGQIWCYITVHDAVTDGRTLYTIRIPVKPSTKRSEAEPTPVQQDIISQAIGALNEFQSMTAEAMTLSPGSQATAEYKNGVLTLGIPRGRNGDGEGGGGIDDLGVVGGMLCVTYNE